MFPSVNNVIKPKVASRKKKKKEKTITEPPYSSRAIEQCDEEVASIGINSENLNE